MKERFESTGDAPALDFRGVTCRFPGKPGKPDYPAPENVSFSVAAGEFVSVVGPTGCGKSTILNAAAGLLKPTEGEVRVFGETLTGINRRAGYMFQAESLKPEQREAGMSWLARVGLERFGDRYPHELSGGMRKRVALAQTLVTDPDILLMDESFSALDIQTRQLMENELLDIWQSAKKAVLFITHDLDEAVSMSDRVVVLSAGPASHPIGNFPIELPRPRNVVEIRTTPDFLACHEAIWNVLRDEVLKSYHQHRETI